VDSIRWEQLRDGIEDYEYLTILDEKVTRRGTVLDAATLKKCRDILSVPDSITRSITDFTRDGAPIELRRHEIARAIEALQ